MGEAIISVMEFLKRYLRPEVAEAVKKSRPVLAKEKDWVFRGTIPRVQTL